MSPAQLITQYLHLRMKLAKTHSQLSTSPIAPLFQLQDGSIATIQDIKKRFNILCAEMKLVGPSRYTIYSMRIGGATSLARRGVDHRMIQMARRWTSDAYKLYIKMTPKMMAIHQSKFLKLDIKHPELVFMHENIPPELLIQT